MVDPTNGKKRFQILTLSGGGYLGLFAAHILAELESRAQRPLARCFDLICGTSIGGIVALGLANEVPASTIFDAFIKRGEEIFPSRPNLLSRVGISPKYGDASLRQVIESLLGVKTTLGEACHRVLIPAVNMTKGSIQMFKTPHHPNFMRDHRLRMSDIGMATSAAPLYFPMAEIEDALFVDGGLFANAPDLCGLHEATHFLGAKAGDVHVLSIGTTTAAYSLAHSSGRKFGAFDWVKKNRILSTVMSSQQQLTDFMIKHQLEDRYLRIDVQKSPEQQKDLSLDAANESARKTICGMAAGAYQQVSVDPRIAQFLAHTPVAPTFFHGPRVPNA